MNTASGVVNLLVGTNIFVLTVFYPVIAGIMQSCVLFIISYSDHPDIRFPKVYHDK